MPWNINSFEARTIVQINPNRHSINLWNSTRICIYQMASTLQLEFAQAMSDFKIMFPDMERDVIEAVLRANQGAVDATIDQLLAMSVDNQASVRLSIRCAPTTNFIDFPFDVCRTRNFAMNWITVVTAYRPQMPVTQQHWISSNRFEQWMPARLVHRPKWNCLKCPIYTIRRRPPVTYRPVRWWNGNGIRRCWDRCRPHFYGFQLMK